MPVPIVIVHKERSHPTDESRSIFITLKYFVFKIYFFLKVNFGEFLHQNEDISTLWLHKVSNFSTLNFFHRKNSWRVHQRLQFNLSFAKVEQIACPIKLWKFNGSPILFYRVNDDHDSFFRTLLKRKVIKNPTAFSSASWETLEMDGQKENLATLDDSSPWIFSEKKEDFPALI